MNDEFNIVGVAVVLLQHIPFCVIGTPFVCVIVPPLVIEIGVTADAGLVVNDGVAVSVVNGPTEFPYL